MYWSGGDSRLVWVACCLCQHLLNKAVFPVGIGTLLNWVKATRSVLLRNYEGGTRDAVAGNFFFPREMKMKNRNEVMKRHLLSLCPLFPRGQTRLWWHWQPIKVVRLLQLLAVVLIFALRRAPLPMTLQIKPRTQIHFSNTNSVYFSGHVLICKICTRVPTLFSDVAFFWSHPHKINNKAFF